jgi:hypothetical protein
MWHGCNIESEIIQTHAWFFISMWHGCNIESDKKIRVSPSVNDATKSYEFSEEFSKGLCHPICTNQWIMPRYVGHYPLIYIMFWKLDQFPFSRG